MRAIFSLESVEAARMLDQTLQDSLAEVWNLEKRTAPFDRSGYEVWGLVLNEVTFPEVGMDGAED